jgi:hypothetical protein
MVEGLPLAIKALEAAPTYSSEVLQSLPDRHPSACQCVLDTLTKAKKGDVRGYNHQCLTKLDEQDLAPLRELMQFAVLGRDCNPTLLAYSDRFNWPSLSFWHETRFSFVNISKMKVARAPVSCKRMGPRPDDPGERARAGGPGDQVILDFRLPIFDWGRKQHD